MTRVGAAAPVGLTALQRAIGNRAVGRLLARRPKPSAQPFRRPRVEWQPGRMLLTFDDWVSRAELMQQLFVGHAVPDGFALGPTRRGEGDPSLYWTLSWSGSLLNRLGQLSEFGQALARHAIEGGDESDEDRAGREDAAAKAAAAHHEQLKTYVPALGMTGAEALAKLKPGVYVAAPQRPIRPLPEPRADNKLSDISWMRDYTDGGVFVCVAGVDKPAYIQIREIGKYEQFWKDMVWYLQHGEDLASAEKRYIELWTALNREMMGAYAITLTSAPSIGPRADLAEEALGLSGIGNMASRELGDSVVSNISPIEALHVALQTYAVFTTWQGIADDAAEREEAAEAQAAHERGDLYELPVMVAESAVVETTNAEVTSASRTLQRAPKRPSTATRKPPVRERVTGFVTELASEYRSDIQAAKRANPKATPSRVGQLAERATLGKVDAVAKSWGLDPAKIWAGDVLVGVTGPAGGQHTVEVSSPYYKFMIELKKSPQAVKGYQSKAHLLAVDDGFDFPRGGRYYRLVGENYKPGGEIYEHESPPKARRGR